MKGFATYIFEKCTVRAIRAMSFEREINQNIVGKFKLDRRIDRRWLILSYVSESGE